MAVATSRASADFALGLRLAWPLGVAGIVGMVGGIILARRGQSADFEPNDPTSLRMAIQLGLLLGLIELLAAALRHWIRDHGLFALAGISGLADGDAISLSIAHMASNGLYRHIGAGATLLAASVNTLVKIGIVGVKGSPALAWRVGLPLLAALASGAVALFLPLPV